MNLTEAIFLIVIICPIIIALTGQRFFFKKSTYYFYSTLSIEECQHNLLHTKDKDTFVYKYNYIDNCHSILTFLKTRQLINYTHKRLDSKYFVILLHDENRTYIILKFSHSFLFGCSFVSEKQLIGFMKEKVDAVQL